MGCSRVTQYRSDSAEQLDYQRPCRERRPCDDCAYNHDAVASARSALNWQLNDKHAGN